MALVLDDFTILCYSDVHLAHRKTPTTHIVENFKQSLPTGSDAKAIHMLVIPGDLIDRHLEYHQDDVYHIQSFFAWLLRYCKRHDIVLRLLEGTPSHDWKQAKNLEILNDDIGADYKYVPVLSVEHIEKFGIDILYIPDEWSTDNDDTWLQVQQLLHTKGLKQVDFTLMHGQFAYQLPPHVNAATHVPERYMEITRYIVFCGHVHLTSICGNLKNPGEYPDHFGSIIVPGSFDRISHGEEGDKGHYKVVVRKSGDHQINFVPNDNAYHYKTIDVRGLSVEDGLKKVDEVIQSIMLDGYIRLHVLDTDPISESLKVFREKYPSFTWDTPKKEGSESNVRESLVDLRATFQSKPITERTIRPLLIDYLQRHGYDEHTIEQCIDYFNRGIST